MDKVQPAEGLNQNSDILKQPEQSGGFEVSQEVIKSAKDRLEKIRVTSPNLADEIRQKLEDIESGKVSAVASDELAKAIKKLEQIEKQSLSAVSEMPSKIIEDFLNKKGNVDLVKKANELGAGYEATQTLMAKTAKRYAEENKS
jgi:DNA-binding TFAR19-related protein (PDSD5 family)